MLTERQRTILNLTVREHVATATPVGSKALVGKRGLDVSSATIRHEMALMEEEGYLTHPYTSAGRMPTEKGYRYFVEHLMGERELSPQEQTKIRHQFHQIQMDLGQWMRLAAAILAHAVHNASLVTMPKAPRSRFKHLELISVGEGALLLVLVLQEGGVRQEIITGAPSLPQEGWSRVANELNNKFSGLSAEAIEALTLTLAPFAARVGESVVTLMEQMDKWGGSEVYHDGLMHILRQPEFSEIERVERILEVVRRRGFLETLLTEVSLSQGGVQILIGGDGRILGILGPMRMPYERCVSTVRYMATLMTDLFAESYGH